MLRIFCWRFEMFLTVVRLFLLSVGIQGKQDNLALNKPTTQSSTILGAVSGRAVDGNKDQNFFNGGCSHTSDSQHDSDQATMDVWWEVDLGRVYSITSIKIWNRAECCSDRLREFSVQIGTSQTSSEVSYKQCLYYKDTFPTVGEIFCDAPILGQFVRIEKSNLIALNLCEVEVYGSEGKLISTGKFAKQSTIDGIGDTLYVASRALLNYSVGALTDSGKPSWWIVDLAGFYTIYNIAVTACSTINGKLISTGKFAKQSTIDGIGDTLYVASRALLNYSVGALTDSGKPSWWIVDLAGFYTIYNIAVTACSTINGHTSRGANVEVMNKDITLCPKAGVKWCGYIPYDVVDGDKTTINCHPQFPVRYVRITTALDQYEKLCLGHVDVQGEETARIKRAYYTITQDKKVSQILHTVGAETAITCGIVCQQRPDCLHFSFSHTAPCGSNCLLTNHPVPNFTTTETGWELHTLDECR